MALVAASAAGTAQRSEGRRGHAGLFGFAEWQADVEDAEPSDKAGGFRREQRTFQTADRDREVGAERRASGVIAESARKVDRDAQPA